MLIGVVSGAVAALFLSPKSGKENRELAMKKVEEVKKYLEEHEIDDRLKEIFTDVTTESKKFYNDAVKELSARLEDVSDKIHSIDKEEYMTKVSEAVTKVGESEMFPKEVIERLKKTLMKGFAQLKGENKG